MNPTVDTPLPRNPFAYRDYRLYQLARFLLTLATQMQSVAVGWQVYAATGRPMDLGFVGLAQFAPMVLLSVVTGQVADRFDRRRVLMVCEAVIAASAVALFALARLAPPARAGAAPIYAVLVVFGAARAFAGPASHALVPRLVPLEHLPRALAWGSSVWQGATIVGPTAGGLLFAASGGASAVFVTSAVLTLAACSLLGVMRPLPPAPPGGSSGRARGARSLLAGVRYVRDDRVVLGAISLDLFAVLLGGATALLPVFARDVLHAGPVALGALRSAPAVGAGITAIALGVRPLERRAGAVMLACVGAFGAATVVFGLSRNLALSFAALLVVGATDMVSVVVRQTLVQVATPDAMRGRVAAVNLVFVGASNELGEFESGLMAAWLGAVPAVVAGGLGTVLVVLVWSAVFPELARIDRLSDLARTRTAADDTARGATS